MSLFQEKDDSAVIIDKSNNILINILAKPGAKQNCITGRYATNATSELFSCKQPEEQQCECGCISGRSCILHYKIKK